MRSKFCVLSFFILDFFLTVVGQGSSSFFLGEPTAEYLKAADAENPRPPVLLLPGLVSSRLVAWKRKVCRGPDINIQDVVWLNLQKLVETMTYDHHCWIDCMKLGKNGTDPPDCKIRADEGLSAIAELSPGMIYTPPGTSIFTSLIKMLAHELGYDRNSIIGGAYDWRLAPVQLQQRDSYFKTLKQSLEVAVEKNRRPAIVIAHSMGTNIFMYFCDWLRVHDKPSIGFERWMRKHIWAYVAIAAPLLGSPGALKSVMSGHQFGLSITEMQARELQLTFQSTHFLNPRSSQNLANKVYRNMINNSTGDYTDPLVTIKSASGGSQFNFGISDVENGEIFRWVGNMYKEPLMIDKYEALQDLYLKDPLKPLKAAHKRPPVKHVIMLYGVDLATEIAYTYRISDNNNPGPPILDEIFYEERSSCRGKEEEEDLDQEGGGPPKTASSIRSATYQSEGVRCSESSNITNSSGHIDDNKINSVNQKSNRNSGAVKYDVCSVSETNEAANACPLGETSLDRLNMKNKAKVGKEKIQQASNGESSSRGANLTQKPKDAIVPSSLTKKIQKKKSKKKKGDCNNEVYGIKAKEKGSRSFSSPQRNFLRNGETIHSGDNTVPYVSLSYAHNWLEDEEGKEGNKKWEEHKPEVTHKNQFDSWVPSSGTTVDPEVDLFHSVRENGDTTVVIEVIGVDHLEVAKHPFVHHLIFENLLSKMSKELCLNHTDITCELEYDNSSEDLKRAFRPSFPSKKDVTLLGRRLTSKAQETVKDLKDAYLRKTGSKR